ncbi:hypothetical protein JCM15765_28900 [Paradesulfitobacterium aromaticivorans]
MSKLYLYGIFHGNLQFSSIPYEQYSTILERCYLPVLDIAEELNCPLGLEFPGYSLEVLERLDQTFVHKLAKGWSEGKWEIIGSGYSQAIFPLIPAEVNAFNLKVGNEVYQSRLGRIPRVAYINEQVFAEGLVRLYQEAGYEAVIMDWDNAAIAGGLTREIAYLPKILKGTSNDVIPVIWNSFISFQRFQRYIHGEIGLGEYKEYLLGHLSPLEDRVLPFYGSDWEIFDYRPGSKDPLYLNSFIAGNKSSEINRLREMLKDLKEDERFEIIAPSEVLKVSNPKGLVSACSASHPIPTKKQAKYNVTRWAVCGRDNTKINTEMYKTFYQMKRIKGLKTFGNIEAGYSNKQMRELSYVWGSDFRTFTTEEKHRLLHHKMGELCNHLERQERELHEDLAPVKGLLIINPHDFPWEGLPLQLTVEFVPGMLFEPIALVLEGQPVPTQIEHKEHYRDGSLRRVTLVANPYINAHESLRGKIVNQDTNTKMINLEWTSVMEIRTPSVNAVFLPNKGGALKEVVFPNVYPDPLVGTISHEYYGQADFSTDQFTGNMIIFDRSRGKVTDLQQVKLMTPINQELFPIRIPIVTKLQTPVGELWKRFYVYQDLPRIDFQYDFRFQNLMPLSMRLGIVTVNPESFKRGDMCLSTVNGGNDVETYSLAGENLKQSESVDPRVSSRHCLGSTEGWVYAGDSEKGVGIISQNSSLYSVPLIDYYDTLKSFYLRVYHTLCENDETSFQFWRGHSRYNLTVVGSQGEIDKVRIHGIQTNQGLIVLTKEYALT